MKLLNRSIRSYLIYSIVILLIAIPLFYFVIQRFVAEEVDESLVAQKEQILSKLVKIADTNSVALLEVFEPDISLSPITSFHVHDSLYTVILYDKISDEHTPYRVLESNIVISNKPYSLQLKSSLLDSEDLIERIVGIMAIILLLLVAGLLIINRLIAKKIWRPFYSTLDQLKDYQIEDNKPIAFEKTSIAEFTQLNDTITSLTKRNEQVYQSQKEFAENASHEMQTPLAIFQGKVELLMQTTPLTPDQAELIGGLADASQRLNRVNKSLLLLTKIENHQFSEKETLSLNLIIEKFIEQYQGQAEEKRISIQTDLQEEIKIQANKALVEILIGNLLGNAIRHNHTDGAIFILLKSNTLVIQNTGKATALDEQKLFRRFQKESTDTNSIGLGLEIARKICALYNYSIVYKYDNGLHNFTLYFNKKI